MVAGAISTSFVLASVFAGCALLLGLCTLFVRAENIERTVMVGSLTIGTSLCALVVLARCYKTGIGMEAGNLAGICILAVSGFALGRMIDLMLGPRPYSPDSREGTLGADLAD